MYDLFVGAAAISACSILDQAFIFADFGKGQINDFELTFFNDGDGFHGFLIHFD